MEALGLNLTPLVRPFVEPWYESLSNPKHSQEQTLHKLTEIYAKTEYGETHGAAEGQTLEQYQTRFPITGFRQLAPYLEKVRQGNYSALLSEPVERWVMTRGTTGTSKIIPTTRTHLLQILMVGARGVINFALRNQMDVLQGNVLNLSFPSEVATLHTPTGDQAYGYSSGTYAKLNPELGPAKLVPRQEEIDTLGGGSSKKDWENRFELVYQKAKETPVKSAMGVTPVMTGFARYLKRVHGILPRSIWNLKGLFCTSVPKIHTRYAPVLRYYFGQVQVVEMYTATEGVFAQQLDNYPYVSPNYDSYIFEVRVGNRTKMLYEMKPREWGSIIISTPMFPRYEIGDLVEAMGKNYFRIIGRANTRTKLEHVVYNVMTGRFH